MHGIILSSRHSLYVTVVVTSVKYAFDHSSEINCSQSVYNCCINSPQYSMLCTSDKIRIMKKKIAEYMYYLMSYL